MLCSANIITSEITRKKDMDMVTVQDIYPRSQLVY